MDTRLTLILAAALVLLPGVANAAAQNTVTWTDNATDETSFVLERATAADVAACQTATTWTPIVTLPAAVAPSPSTVAFVDTVVTVGTTYCYRVKAVNVAGAAPPSNIAGRTVPLAIPAAASGLQVGP